MLHCHIMQWASPAFVTLLSATPGADIPVRMVSRIQQLEGSAPGESDARPLTLARWLFAMAALVVAMVAVGGITRLTESGLSITQWNLVTGILPPLTEAGWHAEYAAYRQTPEYRLEAGPAGMALADFKWIFFWEWLHRLMGRVIGLAYAVPLAWFWVRGAIPPVYKGRLLVLLMLGGLQGVFGWMMVRSGLTGEMTDVSHLWLSLHLMTALVTLALLVWTALDLIGLARERPGRRQALVFADDAGSAAGSASGSARLTGIGALAAGALALQLLLGAWVAGLNAGHASNRWPLMNGGLLPDADWSGGVLRALTHDPFLLHFLHRWWAFAALVALVLLARQAKRMGAGGRGASIAVQSVVGIQLLLGIATVVSGVALWLAAAHQIVAALLVATTAWAAHVAGRRR